MKQKESLLKQLERTWDVLKVCVIMQMHFEKKKKNRAVNLVTLGLG